MGLILITDDAAFSRRMIKKAIQQGGHETLEAANGRECLDLLANNTPDCIISDLLMPEMDGFGLLKELRDRGSKIPVIVLTADIQETARQHCESLGAFMLLKKPPKAPEIIEAVTQALSTKTN